jgi:curved DNA-binding protein CbpA
LKSGASLDQVKKAWRDLVMVWHPDRFPNNESLQRKAGERLKEINAAYEMLKQHLGSSEAAPA